MGADYTAMAVIGVLLPNEKDLPRAKISVRKKTYQHNYKDGCGTEYDPKTGEKLFVDGEMEEIETDYATIVYDLGRDDPSENQKLLKAPPGMRYACGTDYHPICLGYKVSTGSSNSGDNDYGFKEIPTIDSLKATLQNALEPLGLWDESKFGLHTLLYCSY